MQTPKRRATRRLTTAAAELLPYPDLGSTDQPHFWLAVYFRDLSEMVTLQAKPSDLVLPAQPTPLVRFYEVGSFTCYDCRSADGSCAVTCYDCRSADGSCAVSMQASRDDENPDRRNKWYGNETRTDQHGRTWSRSIGYLVQDDFGVLVPVAA